MSVFFLPESYAFGRESYVTNFVRRRKNAHKGLVTHCYICFNPVVISDLVYDETRSNLLERV